MSRWCGLGGGLILVCAQELVEETHKFEDWAHKFVAAHSMVHLTGWFIVPTTWVEARRVARLDSVFKDLMVTIKRV